jgi:hypothetical protein
MYGVDLREDAQLDILNLLKSSEDEYRQAGDGIFGTTHREMPSYAPINALALYALVRHFKPKRVIEVGAGMSTKITSVAMTKNKEQGQTGEFIVIEPYPTNELRKGYEEVSRLIVAKVENSWLSPGYDFRLPSKTICLQWSSSRTVCWRTKILNQKATDQ